MSKGAHQPTSQPTSSELLPAINFYLFVHVEVLIQCKLAMEMRQPAVAAALVLVLALSSLFSLNFSL